MLRRACFLTLFLLFTLVPLVDAQESTLGLSQQDFALFNTATAASAEINAFQFDFALNFAMRGIEEGNVNLDLTGSGAVDATTPDPTLQLVLGGSVSAPQPLPVEGELRVIDNMLYVNGFGALGNTASGWQAMSMDDFASEIQGGFPGGLGAAGDLPVEMDALSGDVAVALATLDVREFITISRLEDESINGENTAHFSAAMSLADLSGSSAFQEVLRAIANAQSPTSFTDAELQSASQMLQMMLSNSAIRYDQYFGTDDNLLRRAALNAEIELNSALLGLSQKVTLVLDFEVTLSNHNQPQVVTVPEGAEVVTPLSADEPAQAPTFALPTPTPDAAPAAAETISANVPVTVDLTGSGAVDLIYSGSSGEIISVTARSLEPDGVLDTTVEVLNADGTRLAFNDDHGSDRSDLASFDSFIGDLKLLGAGDFTIRVSTFSGAGAGQVEVLITSSSGTSAPTVEPTGTESIEPEGEEVITGVVPDNDRFTQSISVQPGDVLTVTVRATDNVLDPRVALIDPGGAVVAENDDHGSDDTSLARFDSRISDFAIIDGGRYTIQITAFGGAGGSFELTIERTSGLETTPTPTMETVETIQDSIGAGETFTHEFSAQAGDVYVITASALDADFDPRLAVYDSANEEIFSNDDHGTSDAGIAPLDARIINLIMPTTGDYVVEVSGYQESAGEFELTLERVATGAPTGSGTDQVFTGDVHANGTFTETFEAQEGDYVTITVRALSQDFDPRVSLLSPDGVIVADNDDHGTSAADIGFLDSRIHNYFITESGTYTIEVQGYRGSAGSFAVTVTTLR